MKRIFAIAIVFFVAAISTFAEEKPWKSNLGLSYVATSGNTSTQTFSGNLGAEGTMKTIRCLVKSSYLITKDDRTEKANKFNCDVRGEKVIFSGLFAFLESTYLRDKFSGYTYRASIGPGIGYDIIQTEKQQLKSLVSSMVFFDKYSAGEIPDESYGTMKGALNYAWTIQENVKFTSAGNLIASLKKSDKYFMNAEAAMNVSINSRFAIGISYHINYQNAPPAEEIKKTDSMFMTSLIINITQ